jgi:hypothetical protein
VVTANAAALRARNSCDAFRHEIDRPAHTILGPLLIILQQAFQWYTKLEWYLRPLAACNRDQTIWR